MRLTNKLELPESIVRAVANDDYTRGGADISVTQLIAPPRQVALMRAHADEIEEDVADRIWSLLGQVVHKILERADAPHALTEERLYMSVGGWRVSGAMDRVTLVDDGGLIQDYKLTSVWSVIYGPKPEWVAQQNIYAELLSLHGFDVRALEVVAILRDWQQSKAQFDATYPQQQVARVPLPVWSPAERIAYIEERVRLHQQARETLPECSADDRWNRGSKWAVMRDGRKSAIALFDHPTFAAKRLAIEQQKLADTKKSGRLYVEERPGEDMRCARYCAVAPFCAQWQRLKPAEEKAA